MNNCRICKSSKTKILELKEFLYLTGDKFDYIHCNACNSICIKEFPANIAAYYPIDYYSYKFPKAHIFSWKSYLRTRIILTAGLLFKRKTIFKGSIDIPDYLFYIKGLHPNSKILDVGSGNGELLFSLYNNGFRNLTGVDPFISNSIFDQGIRILKGQIDILNEKFDLIILNHVFEHLENPIEMLKLLPNFLTLGGKVILRTPIVNKAFGIYGSNWIQLDPPRHLHIFGSEILVETIQKYGLKVKKVIYDSTSFQFWGSEQNLMGISLFSSKQSLAVTPDSKIFSDDQLKNWHNKAKEFNQNGDGDQAILILSIQ